MLQSSGRGLLPPAAHFLLLCTFTEQVENILGSELPSVDNELGRGGGVHSSPHRLVTSKRQMNTEACIWLGLGLELPKRPNNWPDEDLSSMYPSQINWILSTLQSVQSKEQVFCTTCLQWHYNVKPKNVKVLLDQAKSPLVPASRFPHWPGSWLWTVHRQEKRHQMT